METSDLCMYMCRCHLKHELTRWIYIKCFELSNSIHIFINSTEVSVCQCVNSCNWSKALWFPHFISLINGSIHVTVATSCLLCFGIQWSQFIGSVYLVSAYYIVMHIYYSNVSYVLCEKVNIMHSALVCTFSLLQRYILSTLVQTANGCS